MSVRNVMVPSASPWLQSALNKRGRAPALTNPVRTRVAIVGGGFAGVFTAIALAQNGIKSTIVDRQFPGSGISGLAGGFGCSAGDDMDGELAKIYGSRFTKSQRQGKRFAQRWLVSTIEKLGIQSQCKLVNVPSYFVAYGDEDGAVLEEFEVLRKNDEDVRLVTGKECGHPLVSRAIEYGHEFGINGLKTIQALLATPLAQQYITVFRDEVVRVDDQHVYTKTSSITADYVVLATGSGHEKLCADVPEVALPTTNFVLTYRYDEEPPLGLGNFWDSHAGSYSNCFWFRRSPRGDDHEVLIGGAPADCPPWKVTDVEARFETIRSFRRDFLAGAGRETASWYGAYLVSKDTLPVAGRVPGHDHLLAIAGLGGSGIVHAAASALVVRDIVRGVSNRCERIFSFTRERKFTGVGEEMWAAKYGE